MARLKVASVTAIVMGSTAYMGATTAKAIEKSFARTVEARQYKQLLDAWTSFGGGTETQLLNEVAKGYGDARTIRIVESVQRQESEMLALVAGTAVATIGAVVLFGIVGSRAMAAATVKDFFKNIKERDKLIEDIDKNGADESKTKKIAKLTENQIKLAKKIEKIMNSGFRRSKVQKTMKNMFKDDRDPMNTLLVLVGLGTQGKATMHKLVQ